MARKRLSVHWTGNRSDANGSIVCMVSPNRIRGGPLERLGDVLRHSKEFDPVRGVDFGQPGPGSIR